MAANGKIMKLLWYALGGFYIVAGVNHFVSPEFYIPLIPPYFPYPEIINIVAGIAEIVLGAMVFYQKTLRLACYAIIAMLIAFIPAHVYFIQIDSCIEGGLCTPQWLGWVRLVVIHPILILWAYGVSKLRA